MAPADDRRGCHSLIRESFTGAWQQNVEVKLDSVLSHSAVFRCVSLIASDVAKMRIRLVEVDADGIWSETTSPSYSPVLRKPNRFQNRIQFFTNWMESKLTRGNTYVLKERDNRGVVIRLYVLDPNRVKPLVADDGAVYYELRQDTLAGLGESSVIVPAKEIIHDRWNTLFHPLVGLSPIFANGLAATQGQAIQNMSAGFFHNGAQPGGVLTAPGAIADETAKRLKEHWDANYTGKNRGKVAVLGDGLHYEPMTAKMVDSQLVEQLKWSAETVCSVFGVPAYKAGVGQAPAYNNVEALNQQYYSDCLQIHIESVELCLDEGLELKAPYGTEFDIDDLLRMDTATQIEALTNATTGGLMKPDEGRKKLGLKPVEGGDAVYLQEQNYSLSALAKRDALADPWAKGQAGARPDETDESADPESVKSFAFAALTVELAHDKALFGLPN